MSANTFITFETVMDWHRSLPPIVARKIKDEAISNALVDWPEGHGFGSSDGSWALVSLVQAEGRTGLEARYADLIELERNLIARGFDFEEGFRFFAAM